MSSMEPPERSCTSSSAMSAPVSNEKSLVAGVGLLLRLLGNMTKDKKRCVDAF